MNELAAQENLTKREAVSDNFSARSWVTVLSPVLLWILVTDDKIVPSYFPLFIESFCS